MQGERLCASPEASSLGPRRRYSQFALPSSMLDQGGGGASVAMAGAMTRRSSLPVINTGGSLPRLGDRMSAVPAPALHQPQRRPDRAVDARLRAPSPGPGPGPPKARTSPSSVEMIELMTEVQDLWDQINTQISATKSKHFPSSPPPDRVCPPADYLTGDGGGSGAAHGSSPAVVAEGAFADSMGLALSPDSVELADSDGDSDDSVSSEETQRTTLSALRHRLEQKEAEYEKLRRKHTVQELQSHRLEETVSIQRHSIEHLEHDRVVLSEELYEVREKNDDLAHKLECARFEQHDLKENHSRQQRTMNKFREELVSAHQNALSARLEARQAKERASELEKQQTERRMSSEAISSRISELKAIHDEMLELFSHAEQNAACLSNGRKRAGASSSSGERRSGVLNQLRRMLSPRGPETDKPLQLVPSTSADSLSMERQLRGISQRALTGFTHRNSRLTASTSAMKGSSDGEAAQRSLLCGISKGGIGLSRMRMSGRGSKAATMLASIERTRAAVERDTEILRELIQMKDGELERIRNELYNARCRTETLEKALAGQKQKRRKESRRHGHSRKVIVKTADDDPNMSLLCLSQSLMGDRNGKQPQKPNGLPDRL